MFRPWQIWLAFGVCLAVVVAAVGWMSVRAIEADHAQTTARQQAALEGNAQLALWRMDSAVSPLVAQESARPYFVYEAFYAVGRPVAQSKAKSAAPQIPSPLLGESSPEVLLHFQIDPQNRFSSPRVPDEAVRSTAIPKYLKPADASRAAKWLEHVRKSIPPAKLWLLLPPLGTAPINQTATTEWTAGVQVLAGGNQLKRANNLSGAAANNASVLNLSPTTNSDGIVDPSSGAALQLGANTGIGGVNHSGRGSLQLSLQQSGQMQSPTQQATLPRQEQGQQETPQPPQVTVANGATINSGAVANAPTTNGQSNAANAPAQIKRQSNEFNARSQYISQNSQSLANFAGNAANGSNLTLEFSQGNSTSNTGNVSVTGQPLAIAETTPGPPPADAQATVMRPLWIGDELILARRVRISGQEYIQGCLLDWPTIERQLLTSVRDLLPNAKLLPISTATASESAHLLASLPLKLDLGAVAAMAAERMSPVQLSLVGAWGALMLAALAVAMLLRGVVSLSERRGAFVSAVTHELRTPLTTFRMYAEMLADDIVTDESARQHYLQTLRVEADRLTHLVENVLLYARLDYCGHAWKQPNCSGRGIADFRTGDRPTDRSGEASEFRNRNRCRSNDSRHASSRRSGRGRADSF